MHENYTVIVGTPYSSNGNTYRIGLIAHTAQIGGGTWSKKRMRKRKESNISTQMKAIVCIQDPQPTHAHICIRANAHARARARAHAHAHAHARTRSNVYQKQTTQIPSNLLAE